MREGGGAGAQEWEGGALDALRGAGGWGPAGAGGGGTRGNEWVQQQQTKHFRRWREGPSASSGEGCSKTCGWDVAGGGAEAGENADADGCGRGAGRARRSGREGALDALRGAGGWRPAGAGGGGTRGNRGYPFSFKDKIKNG
jgi:hypothetical protein